MRIDVRNQGIDYHAQSDSGMELNIVFGAQKPAEDKSMNPVELFAASLGLCVAAMIRKHCTERELQCGEIKVTVEGDWEPGDPMCRNIEVTATVEGDWDDRRKAAFLKVAQTCPVHESIVNCSGVNIHIV